MNISFTFPVVKDHPDVLDSIVENLPRQTFYIFISAWLCASQAGSRPRKCICGPAMTRGIHDISTCTNTSSLTRRGLSTCHLWDMIATEMASTKKETDLQF